eukprot:2358812-Karenia_brevis.AAC.1
MEDRESMRCLSASTWTTRSSLLVKATSSHWAHGYDQSSNAKQSQGLLKHCNYFMTCTKNAHSSKLPQFKQG